MFVPTPVSVPSELPSGCTRPFGNGLVMLTAGVPPDAGSDCGEIVFCA